VYLIELASACVDRQVIRFSILQDDLVEWWNKCLRERSFCTPPNAKGFHFDCLYDDLSNTTCLSNKIYPDRDD